MTSALIGMPSSPEMSSDFVAEEHGSILLVFNPKAMGSKQIFDSTIAVLGEAIHSQTPKAGQEIRSPGDENNKRFAKLWNSEIEVDDVIIARLDALL